MPSSVAALPPLVRLTLCWGLLLPPPVFAARSPVLPLRRLPAAAAPHHCVLPDGTFRIVRPVEAHIASVPDRDPEADVSEKTLRAYRVYKAAITDPNSSRADIARLEQSQLADQI